MKAVSLWSDRPSKTDDLDKFGPVHDLAFSPDGNILVVAAGSRVVAYDVESGKPVKALLQHKDSVFCVSFSRDGKRFASAGADKAVIIWSSQFEALLRFTHADSVQSLAFNPVTGHLASCCTVDFGIYSPEVKSIPKQKLPSRALCCGWTNDGQYLAISLYNGLVTIRNKSGDEKVKLEVSNYPVWSIAWHPVKDHLVTCDWNQKVSFFNLNSTVVSKERTLGYDPCCVSFFGQGDYLLIGGSDQKLSLYSKEGVYLSSIHTPASLSAQSQEQQLSWVWCSRQRPGHNMVAVGCQDGTVALYQVSFGTAHSLYKDRYAYRDNMTDVVVQHLPTDQKIRVRCRDLVKRIAVYRNRLAVLMPNHIVIYEAQNPGDDSDLQFKMKEKIILKAECNMLVVCASHVVLCLDRRLQSYSMNGVKDREWVLETFIRYIKVIGGPAGREGLLMGLKTGQVMKVFLDNPFAIPVLKLNTSIRCLDINSSRTKLAIVDDSFLLQVYDVMKKELLFQEPGANSVCWNIQNEDMLCYTGNNFLSVKAANFQPHQQKLQGLVVGFSGSKIFCLQGHSVISVEVPQSASLYQYLEKKQFREAYNVACLGVTDTDWQVLAMEALEGLDFDIARKACIRIRDLRFLELISNIEERKKRGENDNKVFLADVYTYQGKFAEAARLYEEAHQENKAVEMYTDLRMFDKAKEVLKRTKKESKLKQILHQEAAWHQSSNDPKAACEMYLTVGDYGKAIELMGHHNWIDQLVQLVRELNQVQTKELSHAASMLRRLGQYTSAVEAYRKMSDFTSQVQLYVEIGQWQDAFALVKDHPELKEKVYVPYANWLAVNDRFEEAQQAFHEAGREAEAVDVLTQLTDNAVNESRFSDASYYYYLLSSQHLDLATNCADSSEQAEFVKKFRDFRLRAEMYHIFDALYHYLMDPFTQHLPEALFNMARYLFVVSGTTLPRGISLVKTLIVLAKQSKQLQAIKVARFCYEKLQGLIVPAQFADSVEMESITIRCRPYSDAEELLPLCFRCSTTNPLLNSEGHKCVNCQQPFVFDSASYDILPLVEFFLEDDISDAEAIRLIETESQVSRRKNLSKWQETDMGKIQSLKLTEDAGGEEDEDPFTQRLMAHEQGSSEFVPVLVNRAILQSMQKSDVVVKRWPAPLRYQFYRSVMPDSAITLCQRCNQLFHSDEYVLRVLEKGCCPFCRHEVDISQPVRTSNWP